MNSFIPLSTVLLLGVAWVGTAHVNDDCQAATSYLGQPREESSSRPLLPPSSPKVGFLPVGIAVDSKGTIYVADPGSHAIWRVTSSGVARLFAGAVGQSGAADGAATTARFSQPLGLAVDQKDNLLVADYGNDSLRAIAPDGAVTTLAPPTALRTEASGRSLPAWLKGPGALTLDRGGNLFVADAHSVRKISPTGEAGIIPGGYFARDHSGQSGPAAGVSSIAGIGVDSNGNVYLTDRADGTIIRISLDGVASIFAGSHGQRGIVDGVGSGARFANPAGLVVDGAGNVFVADRWAIRKITPAGEVSTFAGNPEQKGSVDGKGSEARFQWLSHLCIDRDGTLYVGEWGDHAIRKITPDGMVTTLCRIRTTP